ncbi:MAG: hypothetical protein L0H31_17500, partial [Nocardioidaceae bacterium]|nr:hypothetical protein [Nocardioidaceae bacterium]
MGTLVALALAASACGASGRGQAKGAGPSQAPPSTEAPLIPEPTQVPTTLPGDVLNEDMEDLAKIAERLAQKLPPQRRPAAINVATGSEEWRIGTAYRGYFADPDIVKAGNQWFAYATNTSHLRLPTLVSRDLRTWTPVTNRSSQR